MAQSKVSNSSVSSSRLWTFRLDYSLVPVCILCWMYTHDESHHTIQGGDATPSIQEFIFNHLTQRPNKFVNLKVSSVGLKKRTFMLISSYSHSPVLILNRWEGFLNPGEISHWRGCPLLNFRYSDNQQCSLLQYTAVSEVLLHPLSWQTCESRRSEHIMIIFPTTE